MVTARDEKALVVDLGGSGLRVGLVDASGKLTLLDRQRLQLAYPEGSPGAVEFAPGIADAVRRAICQACARLDEAERRSIRVVVCTSMREGFVLLDSDGEVLYAGPNADYRGTREAEELERLIGPELYEAGGQWIRPPAGAIHAPCRLLWFKRHQPERLERAAVFMMLSDWVASLFSDKYVSEPTCASSSALFDISELKWRDDFIEAAGATPSLFPPIVPTGSVISRVSMKPDGLASACGLSPDTLVGAGGADTQHSLLGCGVLEVTHACIVAGTTRPIQRVVDRPRRPLANTWTSCHVKPGTWVLESNAGRTGSYSWFVDLLHEFFLVHRCRRDLQAPRRGGATSAPGAGGLVFALDPT